MIIDLLLIHIRWFLLFALCTFGISTVEFWFQPILRGYKSLFQHKMICYYRSYALWFLSCRIMYVLQTLLAVKTTLKYPSVYLIERGLKFQQTFQNTLQVGKIMTHIFHDYRIWPCGASSKHNPLAKGEKKCF